MSSCNEAMTSTSPDWRRRCQVETPVSCCHVSMIVGDAGVAQGAGRAILVFGVCESSVAENVNGDGDGRPVGSVMLHESGVDVPDVGENGLSGSWENDVDHGAVRVVNGSFAKCVWDAVVVHMD